MRKALGGTVNDVVLAAITGGFRDLVAGRGDSVDRALRTLVPVSVRRPGERGSYNNRVSAIFAELPIGIEDPALRLQSIRSQMAGLKESKQALAGEALTSMSGFAPPMLLALGARLASRLPQRNLNTGTTNVPGPQFPLYLAGRRMLESFPYIPLFAQVRVAVAIFSYDGALSFGISGDYDTAPDVEVLAKGIERGLADLVALVPVDEPAVPGAAGGGAAGGGPAGGGASGGGVAGGGASGDAPKPATAATLWSTWGAAMLRRSSRSTRSQLRRNIRAATGTIRERRARIVGELPDWQQLRDAGAATGLAMPRRRTR